MNITVIGAAGGIGSQIVQMIVQKRLMETDETLTLVGNPKGSSALRLPGLAADLKDAYDEICPHIEVAFGPESVKGDIIVMAGGATINIDKKNSKLSRGNLADINYPIFDEYAAALAANGTGHEIVVCVSNPNELAVSAFARHLGRRRVIGMGAFLDSRRFRKEIAHELGINRQRIHGFMVGEHGANIVPLWNSVHIHGIDEETLPGVLAKIRKGHKTENFTEDCAKARAKVNDLIGNRKILEAFAYVETLPPDMRVALKPFVIHFSGAKTVMATAQATVAMVQMICLGNDALVSGQIKLEGDFHGIHGTIGVPFVIGNKGVDRIIEIPLGDDEKELLVRNAENVQKRLDQNMV